jgi:hypothetical protein
MTPRVLLLSLAASAACVLPVFAGCGGGTSSNNPSGDDGGSEASMEMDASHKDSSAFADAPGDDGGLPEGAVPPSGKQLVASSSVQLDGVTSDGLAVYTDFSNSTVNAVPVAGGMPTMIGMDDGSGVVAAGSVVLYWTGATMSGVGKLSVWSQAHGNHALGMASPPGTPGQGLVDVSDDGSHVLYFDDVTATTADVFVADTQGGAPVKIVPGVRVDNQQCPPQIALAGAYAVVAYCTAAPSDAGAADAGVAPIATLATFTGASWGTTATLSMAAAPPFVRDKAGTQLLYTNASGLVVTKIAGGTTTPIDAAGTAGTFTGDGSKVVYVTSAGALMVAPAAGGTPTMLASGGFQGIIALSPDDKWALVYKQINAQSGTTDMYLASTSTPGTPTALVSTTGGTLYGDPFTTDSSHALYFQNIVMNVGDFMAAPTAGGMPAKLGSKVWINLATSGTKVLYNDNYAAGAMGATGTADIELADTAQAGAPKLLVTQADANFFLTSAKDTVVYSWSQVTDSRAGIWAQPAQ